MSVKLAVGDVISVRPVLSDARNAFGLEFAVVTEIDPLTLTVVLMSEETSDATELDPIVMSPLYGFDTQFAVVTLAEATIRFDQVVEVLSHVDSSIRDEIVNCRYGQPSDEYEHGLWLLPAPFDVRHDHLTRKIQAFRDWHSVNRDLIYCSSDDLLRQAVASGSLDKDPMDRTADGVRSFLTWRKARDSASFRVESTEERRELISEIQRGSEAALLLISR